MISIGEIASERAALLEEARSFLGTPFHHGARLKGVGIDCAQFLIACYVGRGIVAPFDPGFYAPDWFCHEDGERFRRWMERCCVAVESPALPQPGDILLFRYGRAESHGAIYLGGDRVIHAFRGQAVIEDECGPGTPLAARHASTWMPARWATASRSTASATT